MMESCSCDCRVWFCACMTCARSRVRTCDYWFEQGRANAENANAIVSLFWSLRLLIAQDACKHAMVDTPTQ